MKKIVCLFLVLLLCSSGAAQAFAENGQGAFSSSALFDQICGLIDQSYAVYDHSYRMDEEAGTFYFSYALPYGSYVTREKTVGDLLDYWNTVADTTLEVSRTFFTTAASAGWQVNFVVLVVSDTDHDNVLYACMNGIPVYDVISRYAFR